MRLARHVLKRHVMKNLKQTMSRLGLMALASTSAFAQSRVVKAKSTGNDVKREVKEDAHRVGEALCTGTKAECAAEKAKHRGTEAKDAVVDGAKKAKDKVDADHH